jgi:polar amino acid transport system permease protein
MTTTDPGAGLDRSPAVAAPPPHGLVRSIEDFNARIPFKLKVGVVWLVIGVVLVFGFSQGDFDVQWMRDHAWRIARGVWVTIVFSVVAITMAVILAIMGALGRLSKNSVAYGISGFYTSFFRGTPLIVQLFLWFLALPQIGDAFRPPINEYFVWTAQVAGVVGIAFNYVLPQAMRIIIPPTGNEFIAMMKDTALIGLLGTTLFWADPFRVATLDGKADFKNLEALFVAALVYWGLTAVFSFFQRRLENRMSKGYVRGAATVAKAGTRFVPGGGGLGSGAMMVAMPESDSPQPGAEGEGRDR